MPYYGTKGDFYRGDYYRGDPGIGTFFRGVASAAASFIPGVGNIASKIIGGLGGGAARSPVAGLMTAGGSMVRTGITRAGTIVAKHPVMTAAGAAGTIGLLGGRMSAKVGMHPAVAAAMGVGRRRRRMRVTNPKALRRAIRRAHGFAKLAMKTIHLIHPKKKVRFGGFKKRRSK